MVISFGITITFIHEYQEKSSLEYRTHYKKYDVIISERNQAALQCLNDFKNDYISKEAYISHIESNKIYYKGLLKEYTKKKKEIKARDSILGYTSFKNFLLGIGMPIYSLIMALVFLYVIVKNINDKYKQRFYLIISLGLICCSGYWVSWSFLSFSIDPKRGFDFPRWLYNVFLFVVPPTVFAASYFIFKYHNNIEKAFRWAMDFVIIDVPSKYISEKDMDEFTDDYEKLINKVSDY